MSHRFKGGQKVKLNFGFAGRSDANDIYDIVRLMPAAIDGEMQYRVRGADGHERAICESQIGGVEAPPVQLLKKMVRGKRLVQSAL